MCTSLAGGAIGGLRSTAPLLGAIVGSWRGRPSRSSSRGSLGQPALATTTLGRVSGQPRRLPANRHRALPCRHDLARPAQARLGPFSAVGPASLTGIGGCRTRADGWVPRSAQAAPRRAPRGQGLPDGARRLCWRLGCECPARYALYSSEACKLKLADVVLVRQISTSAPRTPRRSYASPPAQDVSLRARRRSHLVRRIVASSCKQAIQLTVRLLSCRHPHASTSRAGFAVGLAAPPPSSPASRLLPLNRRRRPPLSPAETRADRLEARGRA